MESEFITHVRMTAHQRSKLLCRLDESPGMGRAVDRRRQERIEYRMPDIAVVVQHPGGGAGKFLVHARNISAGGMAFIHGGYVHPGSDCRVALTRRDGRPLTVAGVIAHCRHLEGPHHEVGIRFRKEIDPTDVMPPVVEDDDEDETDGGLPAAAGGTVYSTLEERPGMSERIADFVDEAERLAHQMEKAISDGAFSRVRDLTQRLAGSGAGSGFEAVTKAARDALTALDTSRSVAASSGPLRRLIDLCHRLGCSRAARPIRASNAS